MYTYSDAQIFFGPGIPFLGNFCPKNQNYFR